jgi:hypothetical protein
MADEASIRMTVDSSPAEQANQKYVRAATETFNILKQKSIELGISEKQRIQWMEREVELMKERSRLSTAETVNRLYEDPKLSGKDRGRLVRETRVEGREDVEELKQLNKQVKAQRDDQKTAEQKADRLGQTFSRFLPQLFSAETAGGVASAGTGLLAGLGVAGLLAGIVVSKGLRGAAEMEPAIRDYAILMGGSMTGVKGAVMATGAGGMFSNDIAMMGMTPAEYFTKAAQLYRAGGGRVAENPLEVMAGEKARGISLAGLLGVERYDRGGGTVTNIERYFEKYLQTITRSITEQRAMLPELIQGFTTEASRVLRITGKVNSDTIAASISAVGRTFGLRGEPLQNVYGTLVQGLQQSSNPVIQAMQYAAMERTMPGADLFQIQMAMENPMAHPQYLVNTANMLKRMTGGDREKYARSLFQYGLAPSLTLGWDMSGKIISAGMFTAEEEAYKKTQAGGYISEARKVTGATETAGAALKGEAQRLGFAGAEGFADELKKLIGSIADTYTMTAEIIQKNNKFAEDQLQIAKDSKTFLGKIVHYMEFGVVTNGSGMLPR